MRGVYAALGVVLSAASSVAAGVELGRVGFGQVGAEVAVADVTLQVTRPDDRIRLLPFRFQVQQSTQPCRPTSLQVNGQILPTYESGTYSGSGTLTFRGGAVTATASWTFICREAEGDELPDQALRLKIDSVEGFTVDGVEVEVNFRAAYPVDILEVEGAVVDDRFYTAAEADESGDEDEDEDESTDLAYIRAEITKQVTELRTLRAEAARQSEVIHAKEEELMALINQLPSRVPTEPPGEQSALSRNCRGYRCAPNDIVDVEESEVVLGLKEDGQYNDYGRYHYHHRSRPYNDHGRRNVGLFVTLILAAIFVPLLVIAGVWFYLRRRRAAHITLPNASQTSSTRRSSFTRCTDFITNHRQIRPPRCARREAREAFAARNQALLESCRVVMGRVFGKKASSESDNDVNLEKKDVGTPERSGSPEQDTTMEEELAGFREAARMVDGLVAAEEGRRTRQQPDGYGRGRSDSEVPEYNPYDTPPAYEDQANGPPIIANGFRYTPTPNPQDEHDTFRDQDRE